MDSGLVSAKGPAAVRLLRAVATSSPRGICCALGVARRHHAFQSGGPMPAD